MAEIKIKQLLKCPEITLGKVIHAAVVSTHLLAGQAERILICNQQKRQIIVPQIFIKPVIRSHLQQMLDLRIHTGNQLIL